MLSEQQTNSEALLHPHFHLWAFVSSMSNISDFKLYIRIYPTNVIKCTHVNWNIRNKLQWNLKRNSNIFIQKMVLNVSSAKWRPFCLGLNVLTHVDWKCRLLKVCVTIGKELHLLLRCTGISCLSFPKINTIHFDRFMVHRQSLHQVILGVKNKTLQKIVIFYMRFVVFLVLS